MKRNYGIDALRILSMVMVVLLHVLGNGGILAAVERGTWNYRIAWIMEIMAFCAVDCYALISGYVGVDAGYKYSNIVKLWIQVVFYTVGITLFFSLFRLKTMDVSLWVKAIFPVTSGQYWYFTAYFCMFFFIPFYNFILKKCEKWQLKILIMVIIIFFSVIPTVKQEDIFLTGNGYSFLWISALYILGGYLKKYSCLECEKKRVLILIYFVCVGITYGVKRIIEYISVEKIPGIKTSDLLCYYTSPTILISAMALLVVFAQLKFPDRVIKLIKSVSSLAFGVYLIHTNPLLWEKMVNRFVSYATYNPIKMITAIVVTVLGIYIVCIVTESCRQKVFELCQIERMYKKIDEKCALLCSEKKKEIR